MSEILVIAQFLNRNGRNAVYGWIYKLPPVFMACSYADWLGAV